MSENWTGGVKGGGKLCHVGGTIVGMRRRDTVPPTAFCKVDYQPLEGEMDVYGGDVRSGAAGLPGGRDECSGSLPGVRSASGHGAQDAGLLGSARRTSPPPASRYENRSSGRSHCDGHDQINRAPRFGNEQKDAEDTKPCDQCINGTTPSVNGTTPTNLSCENNSIVRTIPK